MSIGNFLKIVGQQILVGIILVGRLGARAEQKLSTPGEAWSPWSAASCLQSARPIPLRDIVSCRCL